MCSQRLCLSPVPIARSVVLVPSQNAGTVVDCPQCLCKFQVPIPTAIPNGGQFTPQSAYSQEIQDYGSKKLAAGICAILLGGLGIHKFILGYNNAGITMLVLTILGSAFGLCLFFPFLLSFIMQVIGIVEGVIYLTKSDREFYETYGLQRKEWF